jgi:hypothetical protein
MARESINVSGCCSNHAGAHVCSGLSSLFTLDKLPNRLLLLDDVIVLVIDVVFRVGSCI